MDSDSSSSSSISSTSSRSYSRRTHAATYPPLVRWTQHPLWTWRLIHYLNIDRNTYKIVTFGKMFKKLSLGGPQDQRDCFTPMANDIFGIHPIHGPLFRENPNRYIEIIRRRFTTLKEEYKSRCIELGEICARIRRVDIPEGSQVAQRIQIIKEKWPWWNAFHRLWRSCKGYNPFGDRLPFEEIKQLAEKKGQSHILMSGEMWDMVKRTLPLKLDIRTRKEMRPRIEKAYYEDSDHESEEDWDYGGEDEDECMEDVIDEEEDQKNESEGEDNTTEDEDEDEAMINSDGGESDLTGQDVEIEAETPDVLDSDTETLGETEAHRQNEQILSRLRSKVAARELESESEEDFDWDLDDEGTDSEEMEIEVNPINEEEGVTVERSSERDAIGGGRHPSPEFPMSVVPDSEPPVDNHSRPSHLPESPEVDRTRTIVATSSHDANVGEVQEPSQQDAIAPRPAVQNIIRMIEEMDPAQRLDVKAWLEHLIAQEEARAQGRLDDVTLDLEGTDLVGDSAVEINREEIYQSGGSNEVEPDGVGVDVSDVDLMMRCIYSETLDQETHLQA